MALSYQGAHIAPAYDHAAVASKQTGVPTTRRPSNSTTTAHIDHGRAGVNAGAGNWQEHARHHLDAQVAQNRAAYDAQTPPHQKARDLELNAAGERWIRRTQGDEALRKHHERVGRDGLAYHPELLAHMRAIGTQELKHEADRGVSRAGEQAAGHRPQHPVPTPPHKQDTRASAQTRPNNTTHGGALHGLANIFRRGA